MSKLIKIPGTVALSDNNTHENRMEVKSESSNRIYIVSRSKANGEWQCSCPGWCVKKPGKERSCKHLKAMLPALTATPSKKSLK